VTPLGAYPYESVEERIAALTKPRDVLIEACRKLGKDAAFCCFLRVTQSLAKGWIFFSTPPLPDFDIQQFGIDLDRIEGSRQLLEQKIPLHVNELEQPDCRLLMERRDVTTLPPSSLFPVPIGSRTPFLFYFDRDHPLSAIEIGHINRLLGAVGLRLFTLLVQKKQKIQSDKIKQNQPEKPRATRLTGLNWASAYSFSDEKKTKITKRSAPSVADLSEPRVVTEPEGKIESELLLDEWDDTSSNSDTKT